MNLVTIDHKLTMSSEELSELLNLRHDNVRQSANALKSHGVITFTEMSVKGNGRPKIVMLFDRRNSIVMAAKLNDKFMGAVVDRWLDLEEKEKPPQIPTNFAEALQLAADQAKQLELAAPKVAFVDNLVDKKNLMNATQVAQKHGKSAVWLNKILAELKVYNAAIKRGRAFQQWFVDKGYGKMKQTEQGYPQALFTPYGEVWINEKLHTESIV